MLLASCFVLLSTDCTSLLQLLTSYSLLPYFPPLRFEISAIKGMNKAITIKPTMPPRVMINNGSIKAVRLSVSTATSSSNVSATLYNIVSNSPVSSPTSTMLTTMSSRTGLRRR